MELFTHILYISFIAIAASICTVTIGAKRTADAERLSKALDEQSRREMCERLDTHSGKMMIKGLHDRLQDSGWEISFSDLSQLLQEKHNISTPLEFARLSLNRLEEIEDALSLSLG